MKTIITTNLVMMMHIISDNVVSEDIPINVYSYNITEFYFDSDSFNELEIMKNQSFDRGFFLRLC